MSTRRTFFKKLYAAAAIVALAPQLAFKAKPEFNPTWFETWRSRVYCSTAYYDILCDRETEEAIHQAIFNFYEQRR